MVLREKYNLQQLGKIHVADFVFGGVHLIKKTSGVGVVKLGLWVLRWSGCEDGWDVHGVNWGEGRKVAFGLISKLTGVTMLGLVEQLSLKTYAEEKDLELRGKL